MSHERKDFIVKARVTEELYDAVCELADEQDREVSWVLRTALKEFLESNDSVAAIGKRRERRV